MRKNAYIFLLVGLALFTFLIGYYGFSDVVAALIVCGWGLLWISLFHLVPVLASSVAWCSLWTGSTPPPLAMMVRLRWIGESVKNLLPVAQVGGDLVRVRLLMHGGFSGALAGASVVVDSTVAIFTLILFSLVGVWLLPGTGAHELVTGILIGLGVLGLLILAFYLAQRRGLFSWIARALMRLSGNISWYEFVGGAEVLDRAISKIYQNRRILATSAIWRLLGWFLGSGEVWLAMYFLEAPVSLTDALILESLGQAVRSAAFLIPGALGIQEGGYLVIGGMLGLTPQLALALSLTKRVRAFLLGIPGLVAWQIAEGRRLLTDRSEIA
jgi:putative membrane protein